MRTLLLANGSSLATVDNLPLDDAKQLFHVIGYGGSYADWIKDKNASNDPLPFVLDFRKESNALANTFIMDNSKLYAKYCKQKDFNQQLGFLSCVIQNYERAILEAMFTFFHHGDPRRSLRRLLRC
mgnify:CR=1 FL=1